MSKVTPRSFTVSDRGTIDMGYVKQGVVALTNAEKDGIRFVRV